MDLVVTDAQVVTMDAHDTVAQALAIQDGNIMAIGSNDDIMQLRSPKTPRLHTRGATVLPGFIEPHNQHALSTVYSAQRRLEAMRELVKSNNRTEPETTKSPHFPIGQINPVLHEHVCDTAMYVSCVLRAMGEIEYEGDLFVDEGDFELGIKSILSTCESALNMHKKYGDHLPHYVVLTDERPPKEGQS